MVLFPEIGSYLIPLDIDNFHRCVKVSRNHLLILHIELNHYSVVHANTDRVQIITSVKFKSS